MPEFIGMETARFGDRTLTLSHWQWETFEEPLRLFSRQHVSPKFLWQSKEPVDGPLYVGWQALATVVLDETTVKKVAADTGPLPWFMLLPFPSSETERHVEWSRVVIPEMLWTCAGASCRLTVLSWADESVDVQKAHRDVWMKALSSYSFEEKTERPEISNVELVPTRVEWDAMMGKALKAIETKEFSKVVLGRRQLLTFARAVKPQAFIEDFFLGRDASYRFAYDDGEDILLGRSPERLWKWSGREFSLDTIAGTRPRGVTSDDDEAQIDDLLHASKDLEEHEFVVSEVSERMEPLCDEWKRTKIRALLTLPYVHHLVSGFKGILRETVHPVRALLALAPTAAVGGYPRAKSLPFITEEEPRPRGYFCGAIGLCVGQFGEAAITIRSGILRDESLEIYAGAGIVSGSEASAEWDETEQKMRPFLKHFSAQKPCVTPTPVEASL